MKRAIVAVVLLCLITVVASVASAGPAPNLTKVKITNLSADDTEWKPVSQISKTTFYGQNFYIAVECTGYPQSVDGIEIYQNGVLIPQNQITQPFGERQGLGNGYSGYTGWRYQFKIPIAYANGTICVKATSINTGGTLYDTVIGVKAVYQQ